MHREIDVFDGLMFFQGRIFKQADKPLMLSLLWQEWIAEVRAHRLSWWRYCVGF